MNRILQVQENAKLSFQRAIQPGRPVGIFLHVSGTNAAATTSTIADLGTVGVKRNGRTLVNRKFETIAKMMDIRAGSNLFISTEAGEFTATLFIPFYEEGLPQSLNVQGDSELVFFYEPKSSSLANFDALNMTAYTVEGYQSIPEYYEYYILGDDQSISGAVDKPYPLNDNNISAVFVEDPGAIISKIGYKNNNGQVQSSQPWNVYLGATLLENRLETANFDMIEIQLYSTGEPVSYFNKSNSIEIESSAQGTAIVTKCFLIPNERFIQDLLN